MESDL